MSQDEPDSGVIEGYLCAIQNIVALGHYSSIAEHLIDESGYPQKALLEIQERHDFKSKQVIPLILENTEDMEDIESTVDGKEVTHAFFTPDYVALYHEPEAEEFPTTETGHDPLNGWPDDWPEYVTPSWVERRDIEVVGPNIGTL